jgi:hypothetical protein
MKESFLHYIWQFQYFNKEALVTSDGISLQVFSTGILNPDAGPDFQNAKVKIGDIEWVGSVEIHIKSSEWNDHQHFKDAAYDTVVLHVVWINDKPVLRSDGTSIPTLELKLRVDQSLINSYKKLMESSNEIACAKMLPIVDSLLIRSMLDSALVQRLETKADLVVEILKRNTHDWEQTTYELLAKNFGFKINSEPFQQLSRSLPYKLLLKHSDNLIQLEALLFGQAGFLEIEPGDEYYILLKREYKILKAKYSLVQGVKKSQWRFLRLRPANFPTIRIAQFASLIFHSKNLFSKIMEAENASTLKKIVNVEQSDYWQQHYQFNKKSTSTIAPLGQLSIYNLIINSVAPILVAYGQFNSNQALVDRAIELLQSIEPENNAIIRMWNALNVKPGNAHDSQALIELHNSYCMPKRCLDCRIGASIIKPSK